MDVFILVRTCISLTNETSTNCNFGGMNISRHHARIFYDFARRRFALEDLGKSWCFVEGVLHLPGNPSVKLDSQDLLHIGDTEFYNLLPVRSILGGPLGPQQQWQVGRYGGRKGRGREYNDEEDEEVDPENDGGDRSGKRFRREGAGEGYGFGVGGAASLVPTERKADNRSRIDRESYNQQLMQLKEKDVVSSVVTVLSDLCGPGE